MGAVIEQDDIELPLELIVDEKYYSTTHSCVNPFKKGKITQTSKVRS